MKIKTFLEEGSFLRGSLEKIVDVHCYCPADGRNVNCSLVCIKCKHFMWFNANSISCAYREINKKLN